MRIPWAQNRTYGWPPSTTRRCEPSCECSHQSETFLRVLQYNRVATVNKSQTFNSGTTYRMRQYSVWLVGSPVSCLAGCQTQSIVSQLWTTQRVTFGIAGTSFSRKQQNNARYTICYHTQAF